MDIHQQLRDAIAASGQSLNRLGKAASVTAGQLSRFMRGERDLNLQAAARLCSVLGLQFCPTVAQDAEESSPLPRRQPKKGGEPALAAEKPASARGRGKKRK